MHPTPSPVVLKLSRNLTGRDFIVGDIHGAFELLERALARVAFDPSRDRLIATGDLVDRGPQSRLALDWLRKPWFFSVAGNHEWMALDAFDAEGNPRFDISQVPLLLENGLGWWLQLSAAQRVPYLQAFARLPLAIEVDTSRGTVGVIHADVPRGMNWQEFCSLLEQGNERVRQTCLWTRRRAERLDRSGIEGIGRVFIGHTPQWGGLTRLGNVYAVDTGAVYAAIGAADEGAITLATMVCATAVLSAAKPADHINIADDGKPSSLPFGTGPEYLRPNALFWDSLSSSRSPRGR